MICSVGGLLALIVICQLLYPSNRLVPFVTVDDISVGGWKKVDIIKRLNSEYADQKIPIYFGQSEEAYRVSMPVEIGLTISNNKRINQINYPWYLRIVPTSILWVHLVTNTQVSLVYQHDDSVLTAYINKELGDLCNIKPYDASLEASGNNLEVIPSHSGGICDINVVHRMLSNVQPRLNVRNRVIVPVQQIYPDVTDVVVRQLGDRLQKRAGTGVKIIANGTLQTIPTRELFSWIDFSVVNKQLVYAFNTDRASVYLNREIAPNVVVSAGVTTVSTYNFVEIARVNGVNGEKIDVGATLNNLKSFLDGNIEQAVVATETISPQVVYTRSYSSTDTGLSALMQQYTQAHAGVYGVSMIELTGQGRHAAYNDTESFTTASVYKLFVAYSTLKRVEENTWFWSDQVVGGRNLAACFDDMIVKSDNDCAAALLAKIGYAAITNEAHAIGCASTSFMGSNGIKTTTANLATFLGQLQMGQILTQQSSRDRLIDAMKRNIYRYGIPAGISGAVVADKVGFMDGLLHDAAIVYSPTGTYVLVIMTNGSSWGTIADLAKQIEALRIQ